MSATLLSEYLKEQTDGIEAFGELELRMQRAVIRQEWEELDRVIPTSQTLARELESLDERRHSLVRKLKASVGLPENAPFGELVVRLPEDERAPLAQAFRALQVAVLKVRGVTSGIDSYVRGAVRSTNKLLQEVFPDHRGTFYSRLGRRSPADGRAMVVDRRL